jgi:hypothetical protein
MAGERAIGRSIAGFFSAVVRVNDPVVLPEVRKR